MTWPEQTDTTQVELSEDVLALIEPLARHLHVLWTQQRTAEGWTLGLERNDLKRTHPHLLPYELLPESEKVFNRNIVTQMLKGIIALGYRITPV